MSNHKRTEDVPYHEFLITKYKNLIKFGFIKSGTMEVLKYCPKFERTDDVPS
jgi:hypothetical protein